jgi:hypothetical protein
MDIYKCPKMKIENTFGKILICDHNSFLSYHPQKNNFKFVTIIIFEIYYIT